MKTLIVLLLLLCPIIAFADDYGYGNQDQGSQNELKYNPMENQWSYERQDSQMRYNGFENKYEYTRPDSRLRYNPFEGKYEYEK